MDQVCDLIRSFPMTARPCARQASQLQKLSLRMLLILRDYYTAWPERILRPVQFIKAILAAAPWTVNTIAIGRDLGALWGVCSGVLKYDTLTSSHIELYTHIKEKLLRGNRVTLMRFCAHF